MLASEYGWSMQAILYETYPDDLIYLTRRINKRKIDELIMQNRITMNPHLKPEEQRRFAEDLRDQLNSYADNDPLENDAPLDEEAFEAFRRDLMGSGTQIGLAKQP